MATTEAGKYAGSIPAGVTADSAAIGKLSRWPHTATGSGSSDWLGRWRAATAAGPTAAP